MKRLIWLLLPLIILGPMLVAVEIEGSSPTHEITINYGIWLILVVVIIRFCSYCTLMVR
jgi:hypothetical protein